MAVYTEVSDEAMERFIAQYDLGRVLAFKGIAEGVENSNYLLRTERGAFIVTLYERRVDVRDLPFFLGLMAHLAGKGIACPTPVHGRDGAALRTLCDRPAAVVRFLDGMAARWPTPRHCALVGAAMARMHRAGQGFGMARPNALGVQAWRPLFALCRARADEILPGLAGEIDAELAFLNQGWPDDAPGGVIHGDLFPDNVLFLHGALSGLIDFYFACNDLYAYELAICLNAWCFETEGAFSITRAQRMIQAYGSERALSRREIAVLPVLARGAALRFLLTRLHDMLFPAEGVMVRRKDPLEYLRKLRFHRSVAGPGAYATGR